MREFCDLAISDSYYQQIRSTTVIDLSGVSPFSPNDYPFFLFFLALLRYEHFSKVGVYQFTKEGRNAHSPTPDIRAKFTPVPPSVFEWTKADRERRKCQQCGPYCVRLPRMHVKNAIAVCQTHIGGPMNRSYIYLQDTWDSHGRTSGRVSLTIAPDGGTTLDSAVVMQCTTVWYGHTDSTITIIKNLYIIKFFIIVGTTAV